MNTSAAAYSGIPGALQSAHRSSPAPPCAALIERTPCIGWRIWSAPRNPTDHPMPGQVSLRGQGSSRVDDVRLTRRLPTSAAHDVLPPERKKVLTPQATPAPGKSTKPNLGAVPVGHLLTRPDAGCGGIRSGGSSAGFHAGGSCPLCHPGVGFMPRQNLSRLPAGLRQVAAVIATGNVPQRSTVEFAHRTDRALRNAAKQRAANHGQQGLLHGGSGGVERCGSARRH